MIQMSLLLRIKNLSPDGTERIKLPSPAYSKPTKALNLLKMAMTPFTQTYSSEKVSHLVLDIFEMSRFLLRDQAALKQV